MYEEITSVQNTRIKGIAALQEKSKARREQGVFVVEGRREIEHCIESGFKVRTIYFCAEIIEDKAVDDIVKKCSVHRENIVCVDNTRTSDDRGNADGSRRKNDSKPRIFAVSRQVYEKIAYRGGTEGIVAEVEQKELSLNALDKRITARMNVCAWADKDSDARADVNSGDMVGNSRDGAGCRRNPLIVVLEAVEKPGNIGAVLRSADAAGVDGVIICDPLTDIWNPNLIRASLGSVFTVPIALATSQDAILWLKAHGIRILTAQLQDSTICYDSDMRQPTAIVMGTESTGLTQAWRQAADAHIRIPMLGDMDSLNVSVSTAILMFEAVRQRRSWEKIG